MLTQKQLLSVAINAIAVKMFITFPGTMFKVAGNSVWLASLLVTMIAAGVFALTRRLYPARENIITLSEKAFGSTGRVITGVLVFITLFINLLPIVREFPEIIKLVLLQKTYVEIITTALVIALIFSASLGITAVVRVIEIFIPISGLVFLAFLLMLLPNTHINYILPFLGNGIKSIMIGGLSIMSIFTDVLTLNILIPKAQALDCYRKSGTRGIIIGGIVATLIFLFYGLCYVYPASAHFLVPIYQLERLINLSTFFSRLEALYRFVWSIMILLYLSVELGILSEVWCETFRLPHSKPLIAPIMLTLTGFSWLPKTLEAMIGWEIVINRYIYIPALLLPLGVAIMYKIKMFHVKHPKEKL